MEEREKLLLEIKGLIADSQKEGVKKADLDKTARPKEIFNLPTNRSGTDIDKQSSVVSEK